MARSFIRIFFDWDTKTQELTLEEQGRLLRGLLAYARGEEPQLIGNERFLFPSFREQVDRDCEQYNKIVQRNRNNAPRGSRKQTYPPDSSGNQSNPVDSSGNQSNPVDSSGNQLSPVVAKKRRNEDINIYPPKSPTGGECDLFNLFWSAYPRKTAKKNAERAWNKIDPDEALTRQIIQAVERFRRDPSWLQDKGRYIPHPATFLNDRRWEDEPSEGQKPILSLVAESRGREYVDLDRMYE